MEAMATGVTGAGGGRRAVGTQEGQEDPGGCGRREAAEKGHSPSSGQRWPVQGVPGSPGEREQEGMGEGGCLPGRGKKIQYPSSIMGRFSICLKVALGCLSGEAKSASLFSPSPHPSCGSLLGSPTCPC